jgi:hypothetical protein
MGLLVLTPLEAKGLTSTECCGSMDPFVKIRYNGRKYKGTPSENGDVNPVFRNEELMLPLVPDYKSFTLQLVNHKTFRNRVISEDLFSVPEVIKKGAGEHWFDLQAGGKLRMRVRVLRPLVVTMLEAKDLFDTEGAFSRQDPYAQVELKLPLGPGSQQVVRTKCHTDGNKIARWNDVSGARARARARGSLGNAAVRVQHPRRPAARQRPERGRDDPRDEREQCATGLGDRPRARAHRGRVQVRARGQAHVAAAHAPRELER